MLENFVERLDTVASAEKTRYRFSVKKSQLQRDVEFAKEYLERSSVVQNEPLEYQRLLEKATGLMRECEITPEFALEVAKDLTSLLTEGGSQLCADEQRLIRVVKRLSERVIRLRNSMSLANTRLVFSSVLRVRPTGLLTSDLFQEGMLGLQAAALRFEPKRKFRFSTYATFWVRQAVRRASREKSRVIRVPQEMQERVQRWHTGRETRLDADEVDRVEKVLKKTVSLSNADGRGGDSLESSLAAVAPELSSIHEMDVAGTVRQELTQLSDREQTILERRFGVVTGARESLEVIAQDLSLSRERVRQIERSVLTRLRCTRKLADAYEEVFDN